jgi:3-isopropylmalate/(R)-2-methylmalate dehydratase large subunit
MTHPARTLYAKIWADHVVDQRADGTSLIFIDRHLIHEVTTPQAFAGLRAAGRGVARPDLTLAVPDHNVPPNGRLLPIADPESAEQVRMLKHNTSDFGIEHIEMNALAQGIVHVIGPEQGFTLPGVTIVCGDSHTSTHGAFGALGFGIGTSEVEHVLATQTLHLKQSKTLEVQVTGALGFGVTAKDLALAIVHAVGAGGGASGAGVTLAGRYDTDGYLIAVLDGRGTIKVGFIGGSHDTGEPRYTHIYLNGKQYWPIGK